MDGTYTATKSVGLFGSQTITVALEVDGVIFQISEDGNTLECHQCAEIDLPRMWEKSSN